MNFAITNTTIDVNEQRERERETETDRQTDRQIDIASIVLMIDTFYSQTVGDGCMDANPGSLVTTSFPWSRLHFLALACLWATTVYGIIICE